MKKLLASLAAFALLIIGCSTTSGPVITTQDVNALVSVGVEEFARHRLANKPESRATLQTALDGVNSLVAQENWNLAAYAKAVSATGILDDQVARYVVLGGLVSVLVDRWTGNKLSLSNYEYAKAVILGGQEGLTKALVVTPTGVQRAAAENTDYKLAVQHWDAYFKSK